MFGLKFLEKMRSNPQLLEAIRSGDVDAVRDLLRQGADVAHAEHAALREASLTNDPGMIRAVLVSYPIDAARKDAVEAVQASLESAIKSARDGHHALIALGVLKSRPTPELEL